MPSAVRPTRAARIALAACGPSLLTLGLAAAIWQAGPRDFLTLWNDETIYWNESAAFMRAGFEGGYITVYERPARASGSRFGPHGPAAAVLYGSLARVTGWHPHTPYVINLVLVALCAAAWLSAAPGGARWPNALLVLGFWPLMFYLPTNMQEPLHFSLAFLIAASIERGMTTRGRIAAAALVLFIACVTRPTWALIIPAVMWGRDAGWRRRMRSIAIGAVVFAAAFVFVTRLAAPYPYTSWIPAAMADPAQGARLLWQATVAGVRAFVTPYREWYITLLRVQIGIAIPAAVVLWQRHPAARWRIEVAALTVLPMLLAMFAVGDTESGREFHLLAPHVLLALLVVAGAGPRWAAVPALVNLLLCPTIYPDYVRNHEGRWAGSAEVRTFARAVGRAIRFDPAAASGWENTVLMHADALQPPLLGLPPGIGISFVLDWEDQRVPPRSRYLLLRADRDGDIAARLTLTPLAETSLGTLYRNEGLAPPAGRVD